LHFSFACALLLQAISLSIGRSNFDDVQDLYVSALHAHCFTSKQLVNFAASERSCPHVSKELQIIEYAVQLRKLTVMPLACL